MLTILLVSCSFNSFFPMFSFDSPKNFRKPLLFECFRVDQKGTFGRKGFTACEHV